MNDIADLLEKEEPLHSDLLPYLCDFPALGEDAKVLKHPLVFSVPHNDGLNALMNHTYSVKKKSVEQSIADGNWGRAIFLHEKPYRMELLKELSGRITNNATFWKIFGEVWRNSENLWQMEEVIEELLECGRPNQKCMMTIEDQAMLQTLPNRIVVYRGHTELNRYGYSWTFSPWKARWFARRLSREGQGIVTRGEVCKDDVIATFLGRGECEIVVDPHVIEDSEDIMEPKRLEWIEQVARLAREEFALEHEYSFHGWEHWLNVEQNALRLAEQVDGADPLVCQVFALVHDCKRENEDQDPDHGRRAAEKATEWHKDGVIQLSDAQMELLTTACIWHNDGQVSEDPTIGVCWDADRFDLPRVGIHVSPRYLSTEAAKSLLYHL